MRRAVFSGEADSYEQITVLPENLRRALSEEAPFLSLRLKRLQGSRDGRAYKAVLSLSDSLDIETVLLKPSLTRWTVCLSTQVGCAVGCTFCATGLMGYKRSLSAEEITDQVLFWKRFLIREALGGRVDNVVYMGMGEPFAAYENVAESLKTLMDQRQFAIGARHISVSTAGIAPKIELFARDFPQVNLALSLHAANDRLREKLVPLNKAYPLAKLAEALRSYLSRTRRKVFLEYVLLRGENDSSEHAAELIAFVRSVGEPALLHVNLIAFNPTETSHRSVSEEEARAFQARLLAAGLKSTVRQNLGRDIDGACGQLIVRGGSGS